MELASLWLNSKIDDAFSLEFCNGFYKNFAHTASISRWRKLTSSFSSSSMRLISATRIALHTVSENSKWSRHVLPILVDLHRPSTAESLPRRYCVVLWRLTCESLIRYKTNPAITYSKLLPYTTLYYKYWFTIVSKRYSLKISQNIFIKYISNKKNILYNIIY